MDEISSGSCPMVVFDVSGIETLGSAATFQLSNRNSVSKHQQD
jgi:hypothetical protein